MQAEVQGQKITWLTPHALQQVLTDDVDFNVMLSFLEFYEVNKHGLLFSSCLFHDLCTASKFRPRLMIWQYVLSDS